MPRKRMLYPAFFASDQLAELSLHAAVTYTGFWCFCDDRGRFVDDADQLWTLVWFKRRREVPMGDCNRLVNELVEGGQLCRYAVGRTTFLHVVSWDEHQRIAHPTRSKLPPCQLHQTAEYAAWWKDDDTATARWRDAEKVLHTERLAERTSRESPAMNSRANPEVIPSGSGLAQPQCSSDQDSSDQAAAVVREFTRPSQRRA